MKSGALLAAALLLNLAVVFAVVTGLINSKNAIVPPVPVRAALLSPPPVTPPAPAAPPAAKSPPHPALEKKQSKPKAPAVPKPLPRPRDEPAPAAKVVEMPVETRPAASSLPASPELPVTSAQPTPAPPVKTPVSISASYAASNATPPYPRVSIVNEEEGTAMLEVLVQPDGTAGDVRIKTSSGYPLLDKSAKATVRRWRFNPATINGKPIAQWYQVPIQFKLPDN